MTETQTVPLYNGTKTIIFYPNSHRYKLEGEKGWLIGVTSATGLLDKSRALMPWAVRMTCGYLEDVHSTGKAITLADIAEASKQHEIRRDRAADIGTIIHDWAEKWAVEQSTTQNPVPIPTAEECGGEDGHTKVVNGILAFMDWVEKHDVRILEAEQIVYSKKHKYVGTLDLIFTMGIAPDGTKEDHKILHFGDYKTGGGIYNDMFYQESAYKHARLEEIDFLREFDKPYPDYFDRLELGSDYIIRFAKEDKTDKDGNLREEAGTCEIREITEEDSEKNFACFLGLLTCKQRDKELAAEYRKTKKNEKK